MIPLFTIQFGRSISPSYQEILKRCRKFGKFTEGDTNILMIFDFKEIIDSVYDFSVIVGIASGWKSFSMMYRDHGVRSPVKYATTAGNVARCTFAKNKSKDLRYCFSKDKIANWGCRLVNFIGKEPNDYTMKWWYEYGHFASGSSYIIDKADLLIALLEEASEKMCDNCPFFNEKNIVVQIKLLPDEIDTTDTVNWKVEFKPVFIGQKQVLMPVSIRHTSKYERLLLHLSDDNPEDIHPLPDLGVPERINFNKINNATADQIIEQYLKNKNNAS